MRAVEKLLASKRLLVHLSRDFKPVALFQSFSPEDLVLADLIYSDLVHHEYANIEMFTIDTGRLPDAVLHSMELIRERYGDVLKVYYPNALELERFDAYFGLGRNDLLEDQGVRLRKPLQRALKGKNAWLSASTLFAESRSAGARISWDEVHQIPCFNPLARWTKDEISSYAKHHDLPTLSYLDSDRRYSHQVSSERGGWQFPDRNAWVSTRHIA